MVEIFIVLVILSGFSGHLGSVVRDTTDAEKFLNSFLTLDKWPFVRNITIYRNGQRFLVSDKLLHEPDDSSKAITADNVDTKFKEAMLLVNCEYAKDLSWILGYIKMFQSECRYVERSISIHEMNDDRTVSLETLKNNHADCMTSLKKTIAKTGDLTRHFISAIDFIENLLPGVGVPFIREELIKMDALAKKVNNVQSSSSSSSDDNGNDNDDNDGDNDDNDGDNDDNDGDNDDVKEEEEEPQTPTDDDLWQSIDRQENELDRILRRRHIKKPDVIEVPLNSVYVQILDDLGESPDTFNYIQFLEYAFVNEIDDIIKEKYTDLGFRYDKEKNVSVYADSQKE